MSGDIGRCKSCGQQIRWIIMQSGKRNPLDPEPSALGNVELVGNEAIRGRVLGGRELEQRREDGARLYLSHFATCVLAARHRRGKRGRAASDAQSGQGAPARPEPMPAPPSLFDEAP